MTTSYHENLGKVKKSCWVLGAVSLATRPLDIEGHCPANFHRGWTVLLISGYPVFTMTRESERPLEAGHVSANAAGTVLRERLRNAHMSQATAARLFGKSRAWGSQELFADPKKTLRRLLIDQPAAVAEFARALGWQSREEMVAALDLFEEGRALEAAPRKATPLPAGLQRAVENFGSAFPDLLSPSWQNYLAGFRWRTGAPSEAHAWLDLYRDLTRAGVVPE